MNVIKKSFTHVLETAKNSENETFNKKLENKISADVKQEVGFWDALGGWLRPMTVMPIIPNEIPHLSDAFPQDQRAKYSSQTAL